MEAVIADTGVDYSVAFSMAGINTLNDFVGGVTVHIKDNINQKTLPIFVGCPTFIIEPER